MRVRDSHSPLAPIVVIGPTPPPYHGVAVSTQLILGAPALRRFRVLHLDTSDRRSIENIGAFEWGNVSLGVRHAFQLLGMLLRERPGLVYLPISQGAGGYMRDLTFMLPCEWLGIPVVAHLRGSEFRDFYAASCPILRALIRYSLARVARVVVLGESLCSLFAGLVPAERISVIPNGTYDFTRGLDQPAKPTPCVQGLYLANLLPRKGVFVALTAVLEALRRFPELEFVFAGEWQTEADRARGLALLAGRPEASRIRFPGVVTGAEKHRLLLASDFFVFPPIQPEGHPRVVLESMAAGLPIITTRQGAITETVVEGKTGFFVEPGDVRALVGRIADLLNDPSRRAAMGLAARRRFEELYTADIAHARLAALFADVLSLPSAGGQAIGGGLEESHGH